MQLDTITQINRLAATLYAIREQTQDEFVLFIGTGASTVQGRPAIDELREQVLLAPWGGGLDGRQLKQMPAETQVERFRQVWPQLSEGIISKAMRELYSRMAPSEGHRALARLLKENYFRLVLTSNLDSLIEDAIVAEQMPRSRWTAMAVGRDSQETIRETLRHPIADVTLLKLCGDFQACNFAVIPADIEEKMNSVDELSRDILARNLIIVGYAPFDDAVVRHFPAQGRMIYFIGAERPAPGSYYERRLHARRQNVVVDPELNFDVFLRYFAQRVNVFREAERTTGAPLSARTMERVTQTMTTDQPPEQTLVEIIKAEREERATTTARRPRAPASEPNLVSLVNPTVFAVQMEASRRVTVKIEGEFNYAGEASEIWDVDVDELNVTMQDMGRNIATYHRLADQAGRDSWRRQAKREGRRLYDDLLKTAPDLGRQLYLARNSIEDPENLVLTFGGPRNYLGMPYELLHDGQWPLAVRHPFCRQVRGVSSRHGRHFDAFAQELRQQKQPLKVLLIASDTGGLSANAEVVALEKTIKEKAKAAGITVAVDSLLTEKASLSTVKQRLQKSTYHVVHYAGHGYFDEVTGENSGLVFWQEDSRRGEPTVLTARELSGLLAGSQTRLFYLSACLGAAEGSDHLLHDNDYLGIMDAIVQAGVPYVLGFRWYVTDSGSRQFAAHFYERLFTRPFVPERAALYARQQIYGADGTDETWTSPILVAQNLYR
jgi:CHAT domain-containing protein